jgi:prephenate dehydrogenase
MSSLSPAGPAAVRRVLVMGTGVIGTSAALALRRAGVRVALADRDPAPVARAERRGAGVALRPGDPPADVVVIATPPSAVVGVLREAQARGLGAVYTDVASTKARIFAAAELTGCDLETYVPGHPIAGSELSGPEAARPDLFAGRPWVLCPYSATPPGAVRTVAELVALCGAEHAVLDPVAHDRVLAMVSHAPHLVSSALAARFHGAGDLVVSLVGRGLYDVTRIAAGPVGLWSDILEHNAAAVAGELEAMARDLAAAAAALREPGRDGSAALADLLTRGNHGRERIAGSWRTDRSRERLPA